MPNFGRIIKGINKKVIERYVTETNIKKDEELKRIKKNKGRPKYHTKKECNCDKNHPCPLNGECNKNNVVYKAQIESRNEEVNGFFYIGGATKFKERWANHISSFRNMNCKQECALKHFIWKLKQDKIQFNINWSIMRQSKGYAAGDKACLLCLDEKLAIMENSKNLQLINKDISIGGKCLHKFKFLINNWKKSSGSKKVTPNSNLSIATK